MGALGLVNGGDGGEEERGGFTPTMVRRRSRVDEGLGEEEARGRVLRLIEEGARSLTRGCGEGEVEGGSVVETKVVSGASDLFAVKLTVGVGVSCDPVEGRSLGSRDWLPLPPQPHFNHSLFLLVLPLTLLSQNETSWFEARVVNTSNVTVEGVTVTVQGRAQQAQQACRSSKTFWVCEPGSEVRLRDEIAWDGIGGVVNVVLRVLNVDIEGEGEGEGEGEEDGEGEGEDETRDSARDSEDEASSAVPTVNAMDYDISCEPFLVKWEWCVFPYRDISRSAFNSAFDGMGHGERFSFVNEKVTDGVVCEDFGVGTWTGKRVYMRVLRSGEEGCCEVRCDDRATFEGVERAGLREVCRRFVAGVGKEVGGDVLESMEFKEDERMIVNRTASMEIREIFAISSTGSF